MGMQQQSQSPPASTQQLAIGIQQALQGPWKFDARPGRATDLPLLLAAAMIVSRKNSQIAKSR